jgi:hypothetical protein
MSKSVILVAVAAAVGYSVVAFLVTPSAPAQDKPAVAGWEYRYVTADRTGETQLNKAGADGWELAGSFQLNGTTAEFVLKRPRTK